MWSLWNNHTKSQKIVIIIFYKFIFLLFYISQSYNCLSFTTNFTKQTDEGPLYFILCYYWMSRLIPGKPINNSSSKRIGKILKFVIIYILSINHIDLSQLLNMYNGIIIVMISRQLNVKNIRRYNNNNWIHVHHRYSRYQLSIQQSSCIKQIKARKLFQIILSLVVGDYFHHCSIPSLIFPQLTFQVFEANLLLLPIQLFKTH